MRSLLEDSGFGGRIITQCLKVHRSALQSVSHCEELVLMAMFSDDGVALSEKSLMMVRRQLKK